MSLSKSRSEIAVRRQWLYRGNRRWNFADYFWAARDT